MTDPVYDIGDRRELGLDNIADANGSPVDPDGITITIREPDGTKWAFAKAHLTNPTAGTWFVEFTIRRTGKHCVLVETSGNITMAEEYFFHTRRRQTVAAGEAVAPTGGATINGYAPTVTMS